MTLNHQYMPVNAHHKFARNLVEHRRSILDTLHHAVILCIYYKAKYIRGHAMS